MLFSVIFLLYISIAFYFLLSYTLRTISIINQMYAFVLSEVCSHHFFCICFLINNNLISLNPFFALLAAKHFPLQDIMSQVSWWLYFVPISVPSVKKISGRP